MSDPVSSLRQRVRLFLPRIRPSAICIGGQKCGTSALHAYFKLHSEVAVSEEKEIDFFCCNALYSRGTSYYHSHFPTRMPKRLKMKGLDVTPGYLGGAKRAARRIYAYNSEIKLIFLVRDPVDRAFSAWKMYVKLCAQDRQWFQAWMCRCAGRCEVASFLPRSRFGEDFLTDVREEIEALRHGKVLEMPIVQLSLYASYLRHYTNIFPESQMLAIRSERMRENPAEELARICQFIGVAPFPSETVFTPYFEGGYSDECPTAARDLLESFFADDQVELAGMLSAL
ncbi:MAG: hypothetical protein EA353_07380 [Puniceicoccaceae bacterium]|nr:MAG: hypothetical protein EA353_07380 [Puniceicoccaceae bacterium]